MINIATSAKQNIDRNQINQTLEQLEKRIPPVSDKALIDLVNGIQINQNIISYRKNRGFFGQIFDRLSGSDRDRQLLLDGNLIAGQETLHNWVLELTESLKISQIGLQATQYSLLEARNAIRNNKKNLQDRQREIIALTQQLTQLAQQVDRKFQEIENRIHEIEIRLSANEELDRIISTWEADRTYTNLPWAIQIILLTKEIFSSAVITYELETQDTEKYRQLLINKILARSKSISQNFFSISELLDISSQQLIPEDLSLCAAILETRSIPQQRFNNTPILFSLGTTLELAQLPPGIKPKKPGKSAIEICRQQINNIPRQMDIKEFIAAIVQEIANDSLFQLINRQN